MGSNCNCRVAFKLRNNIDSYRIPCSFAIIHKISQLFIYLFIQVQVTLTFAGGLSAGLMTRIPEIGKSPSFPSKKSAILSIAKCDCDCDCLLHRWMWCAAWRLYVCFGAEVIDDVGKRWQERSTLAGPWGATHEKIREIPHEIATLVSDATRVAY